MKYVKYKPKVLKLRRLSFQLENVYMNHEITMRLTQIQ